MMVRLALLLLVLIGSLTSTVRGEEHMPFRIVGYFTSWGIYGRQFFVTDITADLLTHINYAFFNVSESGECILGDEWADVQFPYPNDGTGSGLLGNFAQLTLLKQQYPGLQTLMSVGGWTWSGRFSDVALTDETRQKFARSCVAQMSQYGFDGIDVDWEYPTGGGLPTNVSRPEDKENFTLLLAELRSQLDALGRADGRKYLLTIAAPAGASHYRNIELGKIAALLDWINIMAYDFVGAWNHLTGLHAPLYLDPAAPESAASGDSAVKAYLDAGVPADKIVLGVPFYGRGWSGVKDVNGGLYQPFTSIPAGTFESGVFEYHDLAANYLSRYERHWNQAASAPWLFDPATGTVISYEDEESLRAKAGYVRANHLGGMMFWELALDDRQHTLLKALHQALTETG